MAAEKTVDTKAVRNAKTVATTVPMDLYTKIDDYRWSNRMKISVILEKALTEFFQNHK